MIYLNKTSQEPLYMQIYCQIKKEILDGTLKEGAILAGSRSFAQTLGVSRNTVDHAYSQLLSEGYIASKRGIGYLILKTPRLSIREFSTPSPDIRGQSPPPAHAILYDLTNSSHTSDLFPKTLWKRYTLEGLERLEREAKLSIHLDKQGEVYLRRNLLSYLRRIRGIHCTEEQIIVTSGLQQSLAYICKLLPSHRSTILMEEPGFHKAVCVFMNHGLAIQTVPVDRHGLSVCHLPTTQSACAVYTTPSHQFPTGAILPMNRRCDLLKWAKQNHSYIIEDDFDSEQRYYAKPIPSLQSMDTADCVIYLGTFSKALSPSIRMGYMILPPQLMKKYHDTFQNYNSTVPLLNQYVIGRLIETGQYDRHIRRLNLVFRKRLEQFTSEFSDVSTKVKISSNGSGQYFLLEFSEQANQENLIASALQQGVKVYSTMQFWQDKADCPPNTLFLGFSKIDLADIHDCVTRLKVAWADWL